MQRYAPSEPFRPAPLLEGAHAQTVIASLIRKPKAAGVRRERWETSDGDFVDVDLLEGEKQAPTLLLLHGLEGSSRSGYVVEMLRGARELGWNAAALNFRSCSGETNRTLHSYSSGDTRDPKFVVERLVERYPGSPIVATGFSLGGNVLLKLVAELGAGSAIKAAVAIGVPFDLASCARAIDGDGPMTWLYRNVFVRSLKRKALVKSKRFPGQLDVDAIRRARGIWGFDDVVTAKIYGYRDAADYYANAASFAVLHQIQTPTLLICSKDDPIAPPPPFSKEAEDNPNLYLLMAERGGHVGFVSGSLLRPRYWAEQEALQFLAQKVGFGAP